MQVKRLIILALICIACNAPKIKVEPSFYHFKTNLAPTNFEKTIVLEQKVKTFYIKFFDVVWDSLQNTAIPIAKLLVNDSSYFANKAFTIIPTVYITNEVFTKQTNVKTLASNIHKLIVGTANANKLPFTEVQIDCDWTAKTMEPYFLFLKEIQTLNDSIFYSVTLRLHQVKFKEKMGLPPVKKVMLMCYNMGNLTQYESQNSIIDPKVFAGYTQKLASYSLQMDVALPIFSWYVHFTNQNYNGIIRQLPDSVLQQNFTLITKNKYKAKQTFIWQNIVFKLDDELRHETSDIADITAIANMLKLQLPNEQRRLSLYHLDSITLSKFTSDEIKSIFNCLN
jgi:hypothetical protein